MGSMAKKWGNAAANSNASLLLKRCQISSVVFFSACVLSSVQSVDYCNDQERKLRKAELFARGLNSLYRIFFSSENFLEVYMVKRFKNYCFSLEAVNLWFIEKLKT